MRNVHCGLTAAALLALSTSVDAGPAMALDVDTARRRAFDQNRDLRVARFHIARAEAAHRLSGRLDNPQLEIETLDDRYGLSEGEEAYGVRLSQHFPITLRLRNARHVAESELLMARAEVREAQRELARDVHAAFVELAVLERRLEYRRDLKRIALEMVDVLRRQTARGEASSLDVTQATLTGQSVDQDVRALEREWERQLTALKVLLALPLDVALRPQYPLALPARLPAGPSFEQVLERRPDYRAAQVAWAGDAHRIALERSRGWGDVAVSVFMEGERESESDDENTLAGLSIGVPLPLFGAQKAAVADAELARDGARARIDALRYRIAAELKAAEHDRASALSAASDASGALLRLAQKSYADMRDAYTRGQAALLQVQQAQTQLVDVQAQALDASAAYHRATLTYQYVTASYPEFDADPGSKEASHD